MVSCERTSLKAAGSAARTFSLYASKPSASIGVAHVTVTSLQRWAKSMKKQHGGNIMKNIGRANSATRAAHRSTAAAAPAEILPERRANDVAQQHPLPMYEESEGEDVSVKREDGYQGN